MNGRVLVLNTSFEPINVCTERRAVVMIFKGVARVEEHNGHMLHSQKLSIHAPSVIRLTEYIHIPFERRSLSRKNILLRDHSTCQYCGRQYPPSELTLDHVLPRSRGGESGLGTPELVVIAIVIFLLFGATRLPQLAKALGQSKRAFKDGLDEGERDGRKDLEK